MSKKEDNKRYRQKYWPRIAADQLRRKREGKIWAVNYMGNICKDCGNSYPPAVYDFHHIDPLQKDIKISALTRARKDKLIFELEKCVLLCSNCHRMRHTNE